MKKSVYDTMDWCGFHAVTMARCKGTCSSKCFTVKLPYFLSIAVAKGRGKDYGLVKEVERYYDGE